MNKYSSLRKDERGIASIMIVMIIILMLTLITLSMARNANREQRQALDRQLSGQAFYAAESGINDTIKYIRENLTTAPRKKANCDDPPTLLALSGNAQGQVGNDSVIKYSCVLYDREPPTIEFDSVSSDSSTVVPVQNGNGTGISSLAISWDNPDLNGGTNFSCPAMASLPQSSNYTCDVGMLRIELINSNPSDLNRTSLINNDFTAFIYPSNNTEQAVDRVGNTGVASGVFVRGTCNSSGTPHKCTAHINNVGVGGDAQLYLRVKTLYKSKSAVIISGVDSSGNAVNFKGAQIIVDATGKANDVLKRLQVRVPIIPKYEESDYAIKTSESLCKLIGVYPSQATNSSDPSCGY